MPAAIPRGFSAAMARARALLTDIDAQLAAMDAAGVAMKVLSAPLSTLVGPGEPPPVALTARINDRFAALVAAHPDRLLALASVDAFGGETAARELERAVGSLGLSGACLDCARGDRFLDAPESRPLLETAAQLGVPLFVHPVSPAGYTEHLGQHGQVGILMARGAEGAASILALARGGTLDTLPGLTLVMPMMSASVLLFAGMMDNEAAIEGRPAPSAALKRLYVDTMGFNPDTIRFAVETLGSAQVVVGSDWPIMPIAARARVDDALHRAGLDPRDQEAVRGGNAMRLLRHAR